MVVVYNAHRFVFSDSFWFPLGYLVWKITVYFGNKKIKEKYGTLFSVCMGYIQGT